MPQKLTWHDVREIGIALHEKFEMTRVAQFKKVGFKLCQWIGVGYWQALL